MKEINEELQIQLLNFDAGKRKKWMQNRCPFSALLELTPVCNMSCIHCYLQEHHFENMLSYAQIIKIIDILYKKGIIFLTFTGGEIFTRKDFLDIYLYAKQKGFLVELFTNGYLIDEPAIQVFKEYPPLLVDVSLYGASELTYQKITGVSGAFEKVVGNCVALKKAGVRVSLKSPIMNETLPELENMQQLIEYKNKVSCACKIIKWCAANGYLQQAVTFYIEWLPVYLTDAYLIEVKEQNIVTTCNANKHSWEPWQRYFIREFKYRGNSQCADSNEAAFNKEINAVIQEFKNFSGLNPVERNKKLLLLASRSTLTGKVANSILDFAKKADGNFVFEVLNFPDNIVCKILQNACPPNTGFVNFLNQRLKNEKDIKNIMIKAVIGVKKQKLREILADKKNESDVNSTVNVSKELSAVSSSSVVEKSYLNMINNNAITVNIPVENLIKFTEQYRTYNKQRNKINHANNSFDDESNAFVTANAIIESVNLVDSDF